MVSGAVGTVLADAQFQPIIDDKAGGGAQSQLFKPLGVVFGQCYGKGGGIGSKAQDVGSVSQALVAGFKA